MLRQNALTNVFIFLVSLAPIISVFAPRALSFWPGIIGLLCSIWFYFNNKKLPETSRPHFIILGGISALCLTSSFWSISPEGTLHDALKAVSVLVPALLFINIARSIPHETLGKFATFFIGATLLASLLYSAETLLDYPVYRAFRDIPNNIDINPSSMNRGSISLVFFYFTCLLFIPFLQQKLKIATIILLTITMYGPLMLADSQSSQVAFILGGLVFLLFPHRYENAYRAASMLISGLLLLTPIAIMMMFYLLFDQMHDISWLQNAYAEERLEIWYAVMEYALNSPIFGHGMEATQYVQAFNISGLHYKSQTVLHPHNFSIQIWIEFGAMGVIGLSSLVLFTLCKLKKQELHRRKAIFTLIIAVLAVSSTAYGIWQSWWLGEMVFLVGICSLAQGTSKENTIKET